MEMVEDVVRLMDHIEIAKAHVVGYSMGGFITLKLVASHPERLRSAVVCAAGWEAPKGGNLEKISQAVAGIEHGEGMVPIFKLLKPLNRDLSEAKYKSVARLTERYNDMEAVRCILERFTDFAVSEEELRKNTVPVCSIVGEFDPLRTGVDRMQGVMANQEAIYIPGGDHLSTVRKREFSDAILHFLEAHLITSEMDNTAAGGRERLLAQLRLIAPEI